MWAQRGQVIFPRSHSQQQLRDQKLISCLLILCCGPYMRPSQHEAARTWKGRFCVCSRASLRERWGGGVCVLLPSRVGAIKQLEGAVISEVPTVGWMLCNSL